MITFYVVILFLLGCYVRPHRSLGCTANYLRYLIPIISFIEQFFYCYSKLTNKKITGCLKYWSDKFNISYRLTI